MNARNKNQTTTKKNIGIKLTFEEARKLEDLMKAQSKVLGLSGKNDLFDQVALGHLREMRKILKNKR